MFPSTSLSPVCLPSHPTFSHSLSIISLFSSLSHHSHLYLTLLPLCPYETLTDFCPTLDTHLDSFHIQKHCSDPSLGILLLSIQLHITLRCCIDVSLQHIKTHFLCNLICKFSVTPFCALRSASHR